jgi:hypothetical protein
MDHTKGFHCDIFIHTYIDQIYHLYYAFLASIPSPPPHWAGGVAQGIGPELKPQYQ